MSEIAIAQIKVTGLNPRTNFNPSELEELKKSIMEYGILEPVVVRPAGGSGFELVAGERRCRAASELGLKTIPAVIRDLSDQQVREIMLIENLQRSALEPLEEAVAIQQLLQEDITQEELGKRLGKSQPWIANRLRLLEAPHELKDLLISREISSKHVISLLPYIGYPVFQDILREYAEKRKEHGAISVKDLRSLIINTIRYNSDAVLNIDELEYENKHLIPHFDLGPCKACNDHFTDTNYRDENVRYCLNRRCYSDKLEIARQKFNKMIEETSRKLAAENKELIDRKNLKWDQYSFLNSFCDRGVCQKCDFYRLTTDQDEICLDRKCIGKKEKAFRREESKKDREIEKQTFEQLDGWLIEKWQLDEDDYRKIILLMMRWAWTDSIKKAIAPWGKGGNEEERLATVQNIPDKDLTRALYRLVIVHSLGSGMGNITPEKLQKIIE